MDINNVSIREVSDDENSVLIVQVPRETHMLSNIYICGITKDLKAIFNRKNIVVIGSDINITELAVEDLTAMKLSGNLR